VVEYFSVRTRQLINDGWLDDPPIRRRCHLPGWRELVSGNATHAITSSQAIERVRAINQDQAARVPRGVISCVDLYALHR
jgi:hypothetical protein